MRMRWITCARSSISSAAKWNAIQVVHSGLSPSLVWATDSDQSRRCDALEFLYGRRRGSADPSISIGGIQRHTVRWLLLATWASFVIGGFAAGYSALHTFGTIDRRGTARPEPVAAAATATASPSPYPVLRDFDNSPPPFAAAGAADAQTP